jgi:hypothetical protein
MTEQREFTSNTFLLADCGTAHTRVSLFDLVNGVYRLVAQTSVPSTVGGPWLNVMAGIQHAIKQLTELTGRSFLSPEGDLLRPARPSGAGVDFFALTISAAEPLRSVVVGLLDDVSVASARRALATNYTQEVERLSLSDARSARQQIDAVREARPELILLAGGTDDGLNDRLLRLVETMAFGLSLAESDRQPSVVFAGNRRVRDDVTRLLGELSDLHITDNVRPGLDAEQPFAAATVIDQIYQERKVSLVPGTDDLARWGQLPLLPTATAFGRAVHNLSVLRAGLVIGIDLGSASAIMAAATPEQVELSVRTDLGLGKPVENLPEMIDFDCLRPWLPETFTLDALRDFALYKSLHSRSIPVTEEEIQLEQALTRGALQLLVRDTAAMWRWSPQEQIRPEMLVLRGAPLVHTPRPGQALLMALDALEPAGFFPVALDRYHVLPALGLLAERFPLAVVQSLDSGALFDLGWVVVPTGYAQPGQRVLEVEMRTEHGSQLTLDVPFGTIEVLPLPAGARAEITLTPSRRFDIGRGPGRRHTATITGGAVGLVIDARGRPIFRPADPAVVRSLAHQWHWDMGG